MLIRRDVLDRIAGGSVTLAFRRWRRPTVRSGGTLLTAIGQLQIGSVAQVSESDLAEEDARRAGYATLGDLLRDLNQRQDGTIHRIEFAAITPDPRIQLRESLPDETELSTILEKLDQLDQRSSVGPWTAPVLELLAANPGVLAETLAHRLGMEKHPFKARVRKLKALGLTISLETGYRLSHRGESVLAQRRGGITGGMSHGSGDQAPNGTT